MGARLRGRAVADSQPAPASASYWSNWSRKACTCARYAANCSRRMLWPAPVIFTTMPFLSSVSACTLSVSVMRAPRAGSAVIRSTGQGMAPGVAGQLAKSGSYSSPMRTLNCFFASAHGGRMAGSHRGESRLAPAMSASTSRLCIRSYISCRTVPWAGAAGPCLSRGDPPARTPAPDPGDGRRRPPCRHPSSGR